MDHSKIVNSPSPNRVGKNSFNLSAKNLFTAQCGELLPVFTRELLPADHIKIRVSDYLRTQEVNTAAYTRLKQQVEFFAVPMTALNSRFKTFITQGRSAHTSNFKTRTNNKFSEETPVFLLDSVINSCLSFMRSGINPSSVAANSWYTSEGLSYINSRGTLKLLDMLDYGIGNIDYDSLYSDSSIARCKFIYNGLNNSSASNPSMRVNPYRLLAYQKIWSDFYRDSRFTVEDPNFFNVDKYVTSGQQVISPLDVIGFSQLRYRNYPRDYFTSAVPNPFTQGSLPSDLPNQLRTNSTAEHIQEDSSYQLKLNTTTPAVTTTDLRLAYALEKFDRRQSSSHSQSYKDLIKQHFGVDVPDDDFHAQYIGGASSNVEISENVATAATEQANLGQVGGIGRALLKGDDIEYTAKEHCIIMGIYSVSPVVEYNAYGIDPFNFKTAPTDWFTPEFAGIGYQPLHYAELTNQRVLANDSTNGFIDNIFGFVPIYTENRVSFDRVHGQFKTNLPFSSWTCPRTYFDRVTGFSSNGQQFMTTYPSDLDPIFAFNALSYGQVYLEDGTPSPTSKQTIVFTPQFLVNMQIDCYNVSHMPNNSLNF